jgi:hypothetical protein
MVRGFGGNGALGSRGKNIMLGIRLSGAIVVIEAWWVFDYALTFALLKRTCERDMNSQAHKWSVSYLTTNTEISLQLLSSALKRSRNP